MTLAGVEFDKTKLARTGPADANEEEKGKAEKRLPRTMEPWELYGQDSDRLIHTVRIEERAW